MLSQIALTAMAALFLTCASRSFAAEQTAARAKPVLLYSRYFNAPGESRYLPDGTYRAVLAKLRREFDVRVHNLALTEDTLAGVNVVLIANPSDHAVGTNPAPNHVLSRDAEVMQRYVQHGGGLIVMGNQENHNLETQDLNGLLANWGMTFTNAYTDAKAIVIPREMPLIGGLCWAYYTGNSITIDSTHPARPHCVVDNDMAQVPQGGPRNAEGCLLSMAEPGAGRVVLVTDSGWLIDDVFSGKGIGAVAIKVHDNWEIFRRLAHWCAHSTVNTPAMD